MAEQPKPKTIRQLVMEYFESRPNQDIEHGSVVDWVTEQWLKQGNPMPPRAPWRMIRALHEEGWLIKVRKGVYRYDPEAVQQRELEDFTPEQKEEIMRRDGYRCVICGRGREDGVELHVDHIRPRSLGGRAIIENGQTLCSQHNLLKKRFKQTETGKRMFIRLYELAKKEGDETLTAFCEEILSVYEKYRINSHIKWERDESS